MTGQLAELTEHVLSLSPGDRVFLTRKLWESLDESQKSTVATADEPDIITEALRRDAELSSGAVQGYSHEEVMQAARR